MSRKWFVPFITVVIIVSLLLMQGNSDGRSFVRQIGDFLNYHALLIGGIWAAMRTVIDPILTMIVLVLLLLLPPFLVGVGFRVGVIQGIDALVDKEYRFERWMIWSLQIVVFFFASQLWVRFVPTIGALNPWFASLLRVVGLSQPEIFPAFFFLLTYGLALLGCGFGGMFVNASQNK